MLKKLANCVKWIIRKIKGKPKEDFDTYRLPNGSVFFVPKGETPNVNDNIWVKLPEAKESPAKNNNTPVHPKPIRPNPPPKEKVKADTDGNVVDSMIYGVEAMRRLDLDEDDLKLTKEEIKEVDAKIDRWCKYNKSANETLKDMAEKFKDIQKNPKYHEDISPLLSGATVSNKEVIDSITKAIREVTKKEDKDKKPVQKKRRKRTNSRKKSGEKK